MSLPAWSAAARARVDARLLARFGDAFPEAFAAACRYPIETGGKRFRPLVVLAAAEALGHDSPLAEAAAVAIELVHTYSLVHDDLPAMDDDDERRGRPTAHRVYGEGAAVLIGDALLTEAFVVLAEQGPAAMPLVVELGRAAGHRGMIGGQALDIGMDGRIGDLDSLMKLHRGKTGALIRCAARMAGLAAGANAQSLQALTQWGEAVGLAFQMADDILDAEQDAGEDGPPSYVKLMGIEDTRDRARALLDEALAAVAGLPQPQMLQALARHAVEREV
jgi:geranylgeranyl pyrophosphate synthase